MTRKQPQTSHAAFRALVKEFVLDAIVMTKGNAVSQGEEQSSRLSANAGLFPGMHKAADTSKPPRMADSPTDALGEEEGEGEECEGEMTPEGEAAIKMLFGAPNLSATTEQPLDCVGNLINQASDLQSLSVSPSDEVWVQENVKAAAAMIDSVHTYLTNNTDTKRFGRRK